ncbi:MAG: T9SS type A sorting domain-containing protein, partial [Bacteroidales bacterium]|nr:T9SS type A sorting domain-containing protein [Bacteroidales bacterium]
MYYIASYLVYWYNRMYEGDFPPGGRKPLGIEKRRGERNLRLQTWPNPTVDEFYVRSERDFGAGIAQVIDAQGKVYLQRRFASAEDLAQRPFSLAGLPAGTYVVRLLASDWYMGAAVIVKQ